MKLKEVPRKWKWGKWTFWIMLWSLYSIFFIVYAILYIFHPQFYDPISSGVALGIMLLVVLRVSLESGKNTAPELAKSKAASLVGAVAATGIAFFIGLLFSLLVLPMLGVSNNLSAIMETTLAFYGTSILAILIFYLFIRKYVTREYAKAEEKKTIVGKED